MAMIVKYEEARKSIRTGDPIGTHDPGLFALGIRRVTQHHINHIGGALWAWGRLFIMQADFVRGVHVVEFSTFLKQRSKSEVYWWPALIDNDVERELYAGTFATHFGTKYEKPKWMILRVMFRRDVPDNVRWFCSEIDAHSRRLAAPETYGEVLREPSKIWPKDIANLHGGMQKARRIVL